MLVTSTAMYNSRPRKKSGWLDRFYLILDRPFPTSFSGSRVVYFPFLNDNMAKISNPNVNISINASNVVIRLTPFHITGMSQTAP